MIYLNLNDNHKISNACCLTHTHHNLMCAQYANCPSLPVRCDNQQYQPASRHPASGYHLMPPTSGVCPCQPAMVYRIAARLGGDCPADQARYANAHDMLLICSLKILAIICSYHTLILIMLCSCHVLLIIMYSSQVYICKEPQLTEFYRGDGRS